MNQNDITIAPAESGNIVVESVKFSWNNQVIAKWPKNLQVGIFKLAYAIRNKAIDYVPVRTAALQNSIRVLENGEETWVVAGGSTSYMSFPPKGASKIVRYVDYAAKVEEKSSRPHYMRDAQQDTMSDDWQSKYLGDLTK